MGLTSSADLDAWLAVLWGSHRPRWTFDLLDLDGHPMGSIPGPEDGMLTASADDDVSRGWTGTLWDPDSQAELDTSSPSDGTMHLDRILRIQHTVDVPTLGRPVTCTPMYGWLTKADRNGSTIALEAQGLERRAMFGCKPMNIPAHTSVVGAIRTILSARYGEYRFRFPSGHPARLPKPVNVGLADEVAGWPVARGLAATIDLDLFYSCDGWCTLRPFTAEPVLELKWPGQITSRPVSTADALAIRNVVDVSGRGKVHAQAVAADAHSLSPQSLARHGVDFWMPVVLADDKYATTPAARAVAGRTLKERLTLTSEQTLTSVPFLALDRLDMLQVTTPDFSSRPRVRSFSVSTAGGEMSLNRRLLVANPARKAIRRA